MKRDTIISLFDNLVFTMRLFFGSLPPDLELTLREIKNYIKSAPEKAKMG